MDFRRFTNFRGKKKVEVPPRFFYAFEISKYSEILYYLQLQCKVNILFTLGGQADALADVGSLSPTMVEAKLPKNALYLNENGTE